jgi:signal transduction histidine kinase
VYLPDARTLSIAANHIPGEPDRFAVQLIDVTEPLRMQAATLAAEREHEAARNTRADLERQRDDFVATTSHELRTPITSIVGYGELLTDSTTLDPQERSWVNIITRNASRLSALVEDLLTIGKIRNDRTGMRPRDVSLVTLITEILGNVQLVADQRSITLTGTPTTDTVYVDPGDLHQILTNLISNAVKFTPDHGAITINTITTDQSIAVAVSDTGPGMSADSLEHAFDRFYRAPDAERDSIPGTGLGLAIVAELVERNNGTITLASPASGGLTATVTLPRTPTP